ncbi:MAG: hypothetical protein COW01_14545 [Bdellovibrionales bacterium CG12_big_fil_rev_8_21_14_0_65_38_15]|nr:MAG: hypothetical protein COW79_15675 [Bdellovibrionales bacterium CG22_combo_CG10-13_8_21_14_all_38_13]PIQ53176.1 MAG: hypothetical protein COW01_14545 [Bdellovibrionales bacterium CG12_big_fil_rev_8_21_14_0_65_38_15]PIR30905.1 MAG: hypothetical protein COV38_03170 [Bdellovibrionales bacterium CG11_big_fil_rev_8_21_14_0_20_38_13]
MRVLILGSSGMIGHRIFAEFAKSDDVASLVGVVGFSSLKILEKFATDKCKVVSYGDLTKDLIFEKMIQIENPDIVINACGVTIRKISNSLTDQAYNLNSIFSKRLHYFCEANSIKLIHLSTDCVFNGENGPYTELSVPNARDIYGRSKFLGEVFGSNTLTLRFSAIGRELQSHTELLDWFIRGGHKEIGGYSESFYSGITTSVLSREILKIIKSYKDLNGLYQISGPSISKYELLSLINEKFDMKVDIKKSNEIRSNKVLLSKKYSLETGYVAPSWLDMITELRGLDKEYSFLE